MRGQLRRGQREDEPAVAGVDRRQPQDVGEEGAVGGCVIGVEDRVNAGDGHEGSLPRRSLTQQRWGLLTTIKLPGGGRLGLYEPLHASPLTGESGSFAGRER